MRTTKTPPKAGKKASKSSKGSAKLSPGAVHLVYVRLGDPKNHKDFTKINKSNEILSALKSLTGKKSNAANLMWAATQVIKLNDSNRELGKVNASLSADNAHKDRVYSSISKSIAALAEKQIKKQRANVDDLTRFVKEIKKTNGKMPKAGKFALSHSSNNRVDDLDEVDDDDDDYGFND